MIYGLTINDIIFAVVFIAVLIISIRFSKTILNNEIKSLKYDFVNEQKRLNILSQEEDVVKKERVYLEDKLMDLSGLYAITKDMSSKIRFSELLTTLSSFLEENIELGEFQIVLLGKAKEKLTHNVYQIGKDVDVEIKLDQFLKDLVASVAKSKKPIFLEKDNDLFNFGMSSDAKNLLAIPLVVQRKTIAVFLIKNIDKNDHDKFFILAPQVGLQIERIDLFDNVEKLSVTDGLTKTFLRRYFLERLKEEIIRSKQYDSDISFIMLDLDYFKKCNDSYGHLVGDAVLREVAKILKKSVREIDIVGRYGGEEFSILLPETDKKGAYIVAERIRKSVEKHIIHAYDESVKMTVSMGISSFKEDGEYSEEELIEKADQALYKAKQEGRNKVCLA